MAHIVMAYIVMVYIVVAHIVMAGLDVDALFSEEGRSPLGGALGTDILVNRHLVKPIQHFRHRRQTWKRGRPFSEQFPKQHSILRMGTWLPKIAKRLFLSIRCGPKDLKRSD